MITKKFTIDDLGLTYSVGINQININVDKLIENYKLKNETDTLNYIFNLIEEIQGNYEESIVQFFSDDFISNLDHIYTACYYIQKAFFNRVNISNSKNIELLLYLNATRQIKIAIESFGIKVSNLKSGKLNYCILSNENNLKEINSSILEKLLASEIELTLNNKSKEKFEKIKNFYNFSNNQINCVLNSYGLISINENQIINQLENIFLAIHDLICEKMSLLSLEKFKSD